MGLAEQRLDLVRKGWRSINGCACAAFCQRGRIASQSGICGMLAPHPRSLARLLMGLAALHPNERSAPFIHTDSYIFSGMVEEVLQDEASSARWRSQLERASRRRQSGKDGARSMRRRRSRRSGSRGSSRSRSRSGSRAPGHGGKGG
jgi:hypothetical protein